MTETLPPSRAGADPGGAAAGEASRPDHLHLLERDGRRIHLVGTAHVSRESTEEVARVIDEVRPDTVCVELDEARHQSLVHPEAWREMDLFQVVRRKRATLLLAHLVLSAFQRRLGERLGIRPGAEMVRAVEAAGEAGAEVVLADRDIQVTLRRTWRALTWWDKLKLLFHLTFSVVGAPALSEHEVESLKQQDVLTRVMDEFARAFPRAKTTLIDERDRYMAERIRRAPGRTVVAVVGAGHLQGIRERLERGAAEPDLEAIMRVPRPGWLGRAVKWAIPAAVLGLVAYGFAAGGGRVSGQMILVWLLANGLLSALGAALALAHPLTVAAALLAAPLTSLNPLVAAGWVAGLVELMLHRPRVKDFEALSADILSLRGFWRNGVTRILLVVALANLGSTLGTFIAIPWMTALLR